MRKKIMSLGIIAGFVMSLFVVGCGGNSPSAASSTPASFSEADNKTRADEYLKKKYYKDFEFVRQEKNDFLYIITYKDDESKKEFDVTIAITNAVSDNGPDKQDLIVSDNFSYITYDSEIEKKFREKVGNEFKIFANSRRFYTTATMAFEDVDDYIEKAGGALSFAILTTKPIEETIKHSVFADVVDETYVTIFKQTKEDYDHTEAISYESDDVKAIDRVTYVKSEGSMMPYLDYVKKQEEKQAAEHKVVQE